MRLTNVLRPALMAIALLVAMSSAASRSNAQISLTLDHPFQVTIRPDVGITGFIDFTGTLSIDKGYSISSFYLDFPANAANTFSLYTFYSSNPGIRDANDGGTYSGLLFTTETDWIIDYDYYGYYPGTTDPALYGITVMNDLGETATTLVPFSVTVVAVPEPGNIALLAGAMLSGAGLLIRRRISRKHA